MGITCGSEDSVFRTSTLTCTPQAQHRPGGPGPGSCQPYPGFAPLSLGLTATASASQASACTTPLPHLWRSLPGICPQHTEHALGLSCTAPAGQPLVVLGSPRPQPRAEGPAGCSSGQGRDLQDMVPPACRPRMPKWGWEPGPQGTEGLQYHRSGDAFMASTVDPSVEGMPCQWGRQVTGAHIGQGVVCPGHMVRLEAGTLLH